MKISHSIWSIIRKNKCDGKLSLTRRLGLTSLCVTSALLLAGGSLLGQSAIQINGVGVTTVTEDDATDASAPYVIFSNLGPKDDRYNPVDFQARPIVGREVNQTPEEWIALRFVPKVDVQATVIEAAVGWTSGTKLIQLGIYSNNDDLSVPGTLLPGGQGSTNDIPSLGECCQFAKVTLPGAGVTLTAGTIYWLVASTDDVHGVSFNGGWHVSHLGESGALLPPGPWFHAASQWPAARISGTRLQTLGPLSAKKQKNATSELSTAGRRVRIFSNIDPSFLDPYVPASGFSIAGDNVLSTVEQWRALPFTPRTDVEAQTFSTAIARISGASQINLGVYSDNAVSQARRCREAREALLRYRTQETVATLPSCASLAKELRS